MSYIAPSPPTATTGGHRWNSSSLNCCQPKWVKNSSCCDGRYSPASSSSASAHVAKPSAIFAMWPSNTPIASDGASWNRWLAHGNG
jgi:hypothetical protein